MITPSDICILLHMTRKPNSIIVLLFIENVSNFLTSLPFHRLIAQNSHCSRDIYFQLKKVRRSVILRSMKAQQWLVANNARRSSLKCCRRQTKQWMQYYIVSPFISFCFAKSRICAYFTVYVQIKRIHTLCFYFTGSSSKSIWTAVLADIPQKVYNINWAICFAFSCISSVQLVRIELFRLRIAVNAFLFF